MLIALQHSSMVIRVAALITHLSLEGTFSKISRYNKGNNVYGFQMKKSSAEPAGLFDLFI